MFKKFKDLSKWLYFQYKLNTAIYMLEPAEARLFNTLVLLVLALFAWLVFSLLPVHLMSQIVFDMLLSGLEINDTSRLNQKYAGHHHLVKYPIEYAYA